jgi:hypothetical protein
MPPRLEIPVLNAPVLPAPRAATWQPMELPMRRRTNDPVTQTSLRTTDSVGPDWIPPCEVAIGKSNSRSLMQPQSLAACLLQVDTYITLVQYSLIRVPTDCGPDWLTEAIHRTSCHERAPGPGTGT